MIEVVGRIPLLQATFLEHADVVTHGERFFLVMGHQDRTGASCLENVAHLMAELAPQFAIEVGERFVEQQQLRLRRQGAGEGHALLLTTGKLVGKTLAQVLQVNQL